MLKKVLLKRMCVHMSCRASFHNLKYNYIQLSKKKWLTSRNMHSSAAAIQVRQGRKEGDANYTWPT